MNAVLVSLTPWIDALGRSLLHFFWQGALIGLLYLVLRPLCTAMAARYRLGMAALLLMLVCPLATLVWLQPGSETSIAAPGAMMTTLSGAIAAGANQIATQWQWEQMLPWCVALWFVGVCLIATRSFMHWRRLTRVVREAVALPREWQVRLDDLRTRFGVLRPVRLLRSTHIDTPTLIGWLKPAILLPVSLLSGFTPAQIELIIAHELSHVRRFDYVANLAQIVIETLLFYHPVVYWISRDVRHTRESCCDDLVLAIGGGNAVAYARTLADLEEMQHDFGHAVPALGAGGGVLLARIRRIVDPMHAFALEPLPRSSGLTLPMLLGLAGFALVALRLHLLPVPTADVLLRTSTQSVALLSGNAALVTTPRSTAGPVSGAAAAAAQSAVRDRESSPSAISTSHLVAPATEIAVERLSRPSIVIAAPRLIDAHIANLAAHVDFAAPPIPAVAAPEEGTLTAPVAVSTAPAPDRIVQARYPEEALRAGVTGKVDLDFRIGTDGAVRDIRVLHAQPSGTFEQAAIAALRQWHFAVPASAAATARYSRSFAFERAGSTLDGCREVTGSHICRHPASDGADN